jgi:hypothetical protein
MRVFLYSYALNGQSRFCAINGITICPEFYYSHFLPHDCELMMKAHQAAKVLQLTKQLCEYDIIHSLSPSDLLH